MYRRKGGAKSYPSLKKDMTIHEGKFYSLFHFVEFDVFQISGCFSIKGSKLFPYGI